MRWRFSLHSSAFEVSQLFAGFNPLAMHIEAFPDAFFTHWINFTFVASILLFHSFEKRINAHSWLSERTTALLTISAWAYRSLCYSHYRVLFVHAVFYAEFAIICVFCNLRELNTAQAKIIVEWLGKSKELRANLRWFRPIHLRETLICVLRRRAWR